MVCGGSVELIDANPQPEQQNDAANEGTAAHSLHEAALKSGKSPEAYRGKVFNGFVADNEMIEAVETSVDYIRGRLNEPKNKGKLFIEQQVKLEMLDLEDDDEGGGHLDAAIVSKDGSLEVVDYKHGVGVPVDAKGNKQLMLYALGMVLKFKGEYQFQRIRLTIVQPRCPHPSGPIRSHVITLAQLMMFAKTVAEQVKAIRSKVAPLVAGEDQCRWCPVRGQCPAFAKFAVEQAKMDFNEFMVGAAEAPKVGLLSLAELSVAMRQLDVVKLWVRSVEEYVEGQLLAGKPVPFFKLVEGRSNRRWRDEQATWMGLRTLRFDEDAVRPRSLLGIGAIEKMLKKEIREAFMKKYAEKPPGGPVIAHESDPRPALKRKATDDFKAHKS